MHDRPATDQSRNSSAITLDLSRASLAFCPSCLFPLPSYHTVPFFSFFFLAPSCCRGDDSAWRCGKETNKSIHSQEEKQGGHETISADGNTQHAGFYVNVRILQNLHQKAQLNYMHRKKVSHETLAWRSEAPRPAFPPRRLPPARALNCTLASATSSSFNSLALRFSLVPLSYVLSSRVDDSPRSGEVSIASWSPTVVLLTDADSLLALKASGMHQYSARKQFNESNVSRDHLRCEGIDEKSSLDNVRRWGYREVKCKCISELHYL